MKNSNQYNCFYICEEAGVTGVMMLVPEGDYDATRTWKRLAFQIAVKYLGLVAGPEGLAMAAHELNPHGPLCEEEAEDWRASGKMCLKTQVYYQDPEPVKLTLVSNNTTH